MNETLEHIVANPKERKHETPIFLQHGAWHGAFCWEKFIDYFASLGYEVRAISLPGHGKSSLNKGNINKYSVVEAGGRYDRHVDCARPWPAVGGPANMIVEVVSSASLNTPCP